MTMPTISDIERAICCPTGTCISPTDCYAADRTRSYPVQIHEAAEAVVRLMCERWKAESFNVDRGRAGEPKEWR